MNSDQRHAGILNFKDFRGFKKITNIKDRYKIGRVLGEGSFGQVRIALHRQADVKCAIKIVRKDKIGEHKILGELMMNELLILEETAHPNTMRISSISLCQSLFDTVSFMTISYKEANHREAP